ncbi:hypothetical protein LCGC14_3076950 [marine sediment metagenome]|uniref:VRR-NUC domain-containing protein n=1 Tax=marine sediment metagenome TaxID=412755 RepID=A0A0F8X2W8_9ZZZZ
MELKESDFASWFEDLLDTYGYKWMHPRPARVKRGGVEIYETAYSGHKGYLDYTIAHEVKQRLIFAELKSETGKLSPDQQLWIDTLKECQRQITLTPVPIPIGRKLKLFYSFEVYVWRPSQRDEIEVILK